MNSSNISDYPYYHMSYQLSLNQSIPNGTTISLYFEATVLHCGPNNSWSNDCPNSNNSNLSYQFTYPLGYNSTNNNGNNTAGNNTGGNETSGNNTAGNNTGDDANNSIYIPDYYLFISDFWSDGFDFFGVANVMNGTWIPVNVTISKNDTNYPLNFDHMLALTFHTDGHTEEEHTIYLGHFEDQFSYDVSGEIYVTHETTFVEISFDVLTCLNEICDLTVPVEERFHPADPQYHKSYNTTDFPTVVELSDEIFDLETMTEEEQQNGKEIPRFTFEIEEVDFDGEMYYKIVVTSCQMDLATHHILVNVIWSKDNMGTKEVLYETWNLADPDRVYGFYPANSNSSVTFLDQLVYFGDPSTNGVSVVSTFGVGDVIFIKSGFENGITNDAITITYDMYPEEDDGITLGAVLRNWDFGSQEGSVVNDTSQDNPDSDNDSDSSGLPSVGVFGTLVAIGVSVVATTSSRKTE